MQSPEATVPGTIIDYSPQRSGIYIGSPGLAVLPNGDYVASHDEFGPQSTENVRAVSHIFRSADRGETWSRIATLQGAFWSSLFMHRGALYLNGHGSGLWAYRHPAFGGWQQKLDRSAGRPYGSAAYRGKFPLIAFPGGAKKFTIRYDAQSQLYWSLVSVVPDPYRAPKPGTIRNTLALTSSPDLQRWSVRCLLLHHPDMVRHGFQYVDWLFDGDDILAACRTAYEDGQGGAHNYHDANYLTFHRFTHFRTVTMANSVPLSAHTSSPDRTPSTRSAP